MVWCGWEVIALDILIDSRMDLSDAAFQQACEPYLEAADATMWAPDCSTLSRARERPLPGHPNPPAPLRSAEHPEGIPTLGRADQARVDAANSFIKFTLQQATKAADSGRATVLESPLRSYLWMFPQMKQLRQNKFWKRVEYDACCWGGARCKAQALEGNVQELDIIQKQGKNLIYHLISNQHLK